MIKFIKIRHIQHVSKIRILINKENINKKYYKIVENISLK